MKRLFSVLLILSLGVLLVSGCQQATSSAPTEVPDGAAVAGSIGSLMSFSTQIDATASGLMGIASAGTAGVKAMEAADDLTYNTETGWWTFTYEDGSYIYNFRARAYTVLGEEITEKPALSNTNKLIIIATLSAGTTLSFNFGTEASPLEFNGLLQGTKSLNGTVSLAVTDDLGNTYNMTLLYSGVTLDDAGIPDDGSVTFTFTSNDYVAVEATLVFNGEPYPDETATLTFTAPTELAATSYTINLVDGSVEPASI